MDEVKKEVPVEDMLSKTEAVARKIEAENVRMEANIKRTEELLSRQMLSGKSVAGSTGEAPKVETAKEYSNRIMSGKK
jgi:hypothetical protein